MFAEGVTAFDGFDGGSGPTSLFAVTVNAYLVPSVRPATLIGLLLPVACAPPGDATTVYLVIGEPFDGGAANLTSA